MPGIRFTACHGLNPKTWVCVGDGYDRESIKATALREGVRLSGSSVTTPEELALTVLGRPKTDLISPGARFLALDEILRGISRNHVLRPRFKNLLKLRRNRAHLKQL